MADIDFLPKDFLDRQSARRDRGWLFAIGGVVICGVLVSAIGLAGGLSRLHSEIRNIEADQRAAALQLAELKRLSALRDTLRFDASLLTLVRARPAVSQLVATISGSCPDQTTFTSIDIKEAQPAADESTKAKAPADGATATSSDEVARQLALRELRTQRERRRWVLLVSGFAKTERQVALFMRNLQASQCFSDVNFELDSQTERSQLVAKFQIRCVVASPLN